MEQANQPEPEIQPVPASEKPNKLLVALVVLVLLLLGTTGYLAYQNYQLRQQLGQVQTQPSPSASDESGAKKVTYTNEVCGTQMERQKFSIEIPSSLSAHQTENHEEIHSEYSYTGDIGWFEISCGTGYGGGGCTSEEFVKIGDQSTKVCLTRNSEEKTISLNLAYIDAPNTNVTFSFHSSLTDAQNHLDILKEVLASFKFLD